MALVVAPEPPLDEWLAELDEQMQRSANFFAQRPVLVDLSALAGQEAAFPALLDRLEASGLRLIGVEGADPATLGSETWARPPLLGTGRPDRGIEIPDDPQKPAAAPEPTALLHEGPVRSGQFIISERGELTVIGSVASGAEVIAGGSLHIYGTLRGRAVAGLLGRPGARIFCRRLEAELVAIGGLYKTADDIDPRLRGRAVQIWLEGDVMMMEALD